MRVLQLIDSLATGGAERMAVNIANSLSESGVDSFLCATREQGPFREKLEPSVQYYFLNKKGTLDLRAVLRLRRFVLDHDIAIIHAHSTSIFWAVVVKFFTRNVKVVWHDHYGNSAQIASRKLFLLRALSRKFDAIIAVNSILASWAKEKLLCGKVIRLQNYSKRESSILRTTQLKGVEKKRMLCLANLRPQKDHLNLIEAFSNIAARHKEWSLHLVGKNFKDTYAQTINEAIEARGLTKVVFQYGSVSDVDHVIMQSTIGVLSSKSEGLPVTLIEYGHAGLPVIATDVGQCDEVIPTDAFGILVPSSNAKELERAMEFYIQDPDEAINRGRKLQEHIQLQFSEEHTIAQLIALYQEIKNFGSL